MLLAVANMPLLCLESGPGGDPAPPITEMGSAGMGLRAVGAECAGRNFGPTGWGTANDTTRRADHNYISF